jgi:glucose-6-phosphate 1-dehydrogenase
MKTKLLIFGITGDLSTRKLLPALDKIVRIDDFADVQIIGVSRRTVNVPELIRQATGNDELAHRTKVFSMDLALYEDYGKLREEIAPSADEQLLIYLSVPPAAATQIIDFLGEAGLNTPNVKILFEKPFGVDLPSATAMIERTARYYSDEQIFRIDHYLAKEMAQNIVAFRGGNALITHVWNSAAIEKIEIIANERIDIEGRAHFYEQTGALRDLVQGHLMQLLALTLMDIPHALDWNRLPELRLAALEQLLPADPLLARRAQYTGYQDEVGNPGSLTETFVSLQLASRDPRWRDVPLVLTTGKALDKKATELRVHFRRFHEAQSNQLVFRIQPDEGVEIDLFTKKPGYSREFQRQKLAFSYPEDAVLPDAYEQVLVDAIQAHKSLFTSGEEVLASWKVLQPVLDHWNMSSEQPSQYKKGSTTHNVCSVE